MDSFQLSNIDISATDMTNRYCSISVEKRIPRELDPEKDIDFKIQADIARAVMI